MRRSDNRRVQGSLTDYLRPIGVGMCLVSTLLTLEVAASLPVDFGRMAAGGTLLAGVEGGHELDGHARQFGLVFQFVRHVSERPGMQVSPICLTSLYPATDVPEVFKSYPFAGAFGIRDNFFTDTMVDITSKQGLFAATFLQQSLSGLCALALETATDTAIPLPHTVDLSAAEQFAVAGCGEYDKAEINANVVRYWRTFRFWDGDTDEQVELPVAQNKVGFAAWEPKQFPLTVSADERNLLPTLNRPNRNGILFGLPRENTKIVRETPKRPELSLNISIQFVRIPDFGNTANNHLRGQNGELPANGMVTALVQVELSESLLSERDFGESVATAIGFLNSITQGKDLFLVRSQLHLTNQLHGNRLYSNMEIVNTKRKETAIPPLPLKRRGFLA